MLKISFSNQRGYSQRSTPWKVQKSALPSFIYVFMTDSTKTLHPRNPSNLETQFPWYKFKLNRNLNLDLYREIPRKLSFSMWWHRLYAHFIILVCGAAAQEWKNRTLVGHALSRKANFSIGSICNRQLTTKIKYHRFAFVYCGWATRVRFLHSWAVFIY